MTTLREEFEPQLISPHGAHLNTARCKRAWNEETWSEGFMREQVAVANVWLTQVASKRKTINKRVGSSYGVKHAVEHWWRQQCQENVYVSKDVV